MFRRALTGDRKRLPIVDSMTVKGAQIMTQSGRYRRPTGLFHT